ncbi:hypothetical protein HDU87_008006 [Geranomyces variabilis]|uniref:Uncharacterized protein n=1 Tax=Geranomyces variabilis TaxID=109894 RepID=A0AAD5TP33_9FUNG|nr:hypothetical protein HDU87_008006 [Geranomyces variabilis]
MRKKRNDQNTRNFPSSTLQTATPVNLKGAEPAGQMASQHQQIHQYQHRQQEPNEHRVQRQQPQQQQPQRPTASLSQPALASSSPSHSTLSTSSSSLKKKAAAPGSTTASASTVPRTTLSYCNTDDLERLQKETERMEEQLRALRKTMAHSREQKAASGRNTVWRAGGQPGAKGAGSLSSYASDVLATKNAALQRSKYGGVVQEAEARMKKMSASLESAVPSSAQLTQQHPQYATASTSQKPSAVASPAVAAPAKDVPSVPVAGGPLPTTVRPGGGASAAAAASSPSRRASEMLPREYIHPQQDFSGRRASEIVGPPPTGLSANFTAAAGTGGPTSRPAARMWRVPSALGTNLGPPPPPSKSPTAAPGVNPYVALPPGTSRRSSELHHLSSLRRASAAYNEDGLPYRRDPNAAGPMPVVAVPPPTASADIEKDIAADAVAASKSDSAAAKPTNTPRLLDGTYDEASSHQAFQDALKEWRASKSKSENTDSSDKPQPQSRANGRQKSGDDSPEPLSALDNNARPTPPPLRARRATDASSSGSSTGLLPTAVAPSSSSASVAATRSRSGSLASFGQSFTNLAGSFVGEVLRRGASSMHLRSGAGAGSSAGGEKSAATAGADTPSSTPDMVPATAAGGRQVGPSSAPDVFATGAAAVSTQSTTDASASTERIAAARAAADAAFGHVPGSGGPAGLTYMERLLLERLRAGEKQQQQYPAVVGIEPAGPHSALPAALGADMDADEDDLEMGGPEWAAARGHQVLNVDTTPAVGAGVEEDPQQRPFDSDDGNADIVPVSAGAWPSSSQTSHSSLGRSRAGTVTSNPTSPLRGRSVVAAVVVEDVTGREDEAIMQAGRPVEVVSSEKSVVEEPDESAYTLPFYKGR